MHEGRYVFAQLMQHLPLTTFRRCVVRYRGEHRIKRFSCLDQYLCLAFAQLTWRESLRDIEACLRACPKPAPFMSWIAAISISSVWRALMMPEASSSPALSRGDHLGVSADDGADLHRAPDQE